VGTHKGKEALTIGQGARIGGVAEKYFIVGANVHAQDPNIVSSLGARFELEPSDVLVGE
jgi:hypothetical protein